MCLKLEIPKRFFDDPSVVKTSVLPGALVACLFHGCNFEPATYGPARDRIRSRTVTHYIRSSFRSQTIVLLHHPSFLEYRVHVILRFTSSPINSSQDITFSHLYNGAITFDACSNHIVYTWESQEFYLYRSFAQMLSGLQDPPYAVLFSPRYFKLESVQLCTICFIASLRSLHPIDLERRRHPRQLGKQRWPRGYLDGAFALLFDYRTGRPLIVARYT